MLDIELGAASARASACGKAHLSALDEAETVTLAMAREFAPCVALRPCKHTQREEIRGGERLLPARVMGLRSREVNMLSAKTKGHESLLL